MHIVQYYKSIMPPADYGGVQRIIFWLTRALDKMGCHVTVMAHPESTVKELLPNVDFIPLPGNGDDYRRLIPKDADIIHFHRSPLPGGPPAIPFIVTEHGNRNHFNDYAPNTVFVSRRHAENHNAPVYVYNGIPLDEYPFQMDKQNYMLFLSKLNWRAKNAKTAIQLSFDLSMPLKLAGGNLRDAKKIWGPWLLRLLFKSHLLENVGMVVGESKLRLLQNAGILFHAVNWEEPFGIVIHEALACGTPVLASPNGAMPEFIVSGQNGFIVSSYSEALAALRRLQSMSVSERRAMAEHCRQSAYPIETTAAQYLKLYQEIIDSGGLYPEETLKKISFRRPPCIKVGKKIFAF